jgi:hypothetical protein
MHDLWAICPAVLFVSHWLTRSFAVFRITQPNKTSGDTKVLSISLKTRPPPQKKKIFSLSSSQDMSIFTPQALFAFIFYLSEYTLAR